MVQPTLDHLPRVPEPHPLEPAAAAAVPPTPHAGDDEKLFSDLYIRTTWFDAAIALNQIDKGKARGRRSSIYVRQLCQRQLFRLGRGVDKHAGKILFVAVLVLATFSVALKSAIFEADVNPLWIEVGGRLERELAYTHAQIGELDTSTHNQLLIQAPKDQQNGSSVLHQAALLAHLEMVKGALSVQVHMHDITWSAKDMCHAPTIPSFDAHYIEQIFENVMPCTVITPLDCFWEGSKLLGPDHPVHIPNFSSKVQWTSLNPKQLLQSVKSFNYQFPFDTLEQYMKRAGITTGYTEKPCLDPHDPQCPETAPNKLSLQVPDIGAVLSGGCYGFAAKYMHWPEELLVGGVTKNRTGHIKKARALQTVVQLMGPRELYEHWQGHYKVHYIDWSREKAAAILGAWQKKFAQEVRRLSTPPNQFHYFAFSAAILSELLRGSSGWSGWHLTGGAVCLLIYVTTILWRSADRVRGQAAVGCAGVILCGATTAAALGFCALLGLPFNVATAQVAPVLAIGVATAQILSITYAYRDTRTSHPPLDTAHVLRGAGSSVLFSGAVTSGALFTCAAFLPIPLLRQFSLQSAILILANLVACLIVFPACVTLDLRRRRVGHADLLCCVKCAQQPHEREGLVKEGGKCQRSKGFIGKYVEGLNNGKVKMLGLSILVALMIFSGWSSLRLPAGHALTDLIPRNSTAHAFLSVRAKLFGFYHAFAVTGGDFEYPTAQGQKLLHEYHESFVRVARVTKNDDGGMPDAWLHLFRQWLRNLQKSFDHDYREGRITNERWHANASDEGILAYKLLVQTGHVDNPIDKSLIGQARLVDEEGIINPKAFYNYLSAWAWNDALAYAASQGNLRPEPREWYHSANDFELKIPKSAPLTYAQLPFYLDGLYDTTDITAVIAQIRDICQRFEERGLPNYPSGIPFLYWEQYLNLRLLILLGVLSALMVTFACCLALLLSGWAATLCTIQSALQLCQLLGCMHLLDLKLSAVTGAALIATVGLGATVNAQIMLGFITSIGSRARRLRLALEHTLPHQLHALSLSLLCALLLSLSPFDFIARHFAFLLAAHHLLAVTNALFFFPLILLQCGCSAELVPLQHQNRIATPSPQLRQKGTRGVAKSISVKGRGSGSKKSRAPPPAPAGDPSLTTITEEPPSWRSSAASLGQQSQHSRSAGDAQPLQSIIVQPEVTVETAAGNTKVTAHAHIKVELFTVPGRARTTSYHSSGDGSS